ncbi:uncharacterized protein [Aegilops tauschii subsp. strangulata]|uniref:uncharacterized protein n=1 Tax=Aegilops tauschii subsp. strangulata TaxID=200361 RepID=UPI003CC8A2C4
MYPPPATRGLCWRRRCRHPVQLPVQGPRPGRTSGGQFRGVGAVQRGRPGDEAVHHGVPVPLLQVLKNGVEVKLQRNALSVLEAPATGISTSNSSSISTSISISISTSNSSSISTSISTSNSSSISTSKSSSISKSNSSSILTSISTSNSSSISTSISTSYSSSISTSISTSNSLHYPKIVQGICIYLSRACKSWRWGVVEVWEIHVFQATEKNFQGLITVIKSLSNDVKILKSLPAKRCFVSSFPATTERCASVEDQMIRERR